MKLFSPEAVSAECRLLLEAGHTQISGSSEAAASALDDPNLDWAELMRLAHHHRVFPLLYRYLLPHRSRVPAAAWQEAEEQAQALLWRNLGLTRELLAILDALDAHRIVAVPYKGPVLAAAVYGAIELREFADLDVLVKRGDLPRAAAALVEFGFRSGLPGRWVEDAVFLKTEYHFPFVHAQTGTLLELHAGFAPHYFCFDLPLESAFERLERITLAGAEVRVLAAEDLVLALAAHGAKHCWEWLEFVFTLAMLVRARHGPPWEVVFARARAIGAHRILSVALLLVEELAGQALPPEAAALMETGPAIRALACRGAAAALGIAASQPHVISAPRYHLASRERLRDQARYCWRLAFAPNSEELGWLPLPKRLFPLYRVLRPLRASVGSAGQIAAHMWRRSGMEDNR